MEREQDAVQETEVKIVDKGPDQPVSDRWHRVGQQDQEFRHPRGPHTGLVDQKRNRHREHNLDGDGKRREDQRVLQREEEQRVGQDAAIVVEADKRKNAPAQLGERHLVHRQIGRVEDRVSQHESQRGQRGDVHHYAKHIRRHLGTKGPCGLAHRRRMSVSDQMRLSHVRACVSLGCFTITTTSSGRCRSNLSDFDSF